MTFDEVAEKRRSIRKYDASKKVGREQIEEIIKCAITAPSWKNSQTARYYCAVSNEAIERARAALPEFNRKNSLGAVLVVTTFVACRSGFDNDGNSVNECENGWGYYDLGLANQNFVMKAAEMGLGTLIMGIRDGAALKRVFNIPDEETVVSVIAVGYPNINPDMPKRKNVGEITKWY